VKDRKVQKELYLQIAECAPSKNIIPQLKFILASFPNIKFCADIRFGFTTS